MSDSDIFIYQADPSFDREALTFLVIEIIMRHNISLIEYNVTQYMNFDYVRIARIPNIKTVAIFSYKFKNYGEQNGLDFSTLINSTNKCLVVRKVDMEYCPTLTLLWPNGVENIQDIYSYPKVELYEKYQVFMATRLDFDKWNAIENGLRFAEDNCYQVVLAGIPVLSGEYDIKNKIQQEFPNLHIKYIGFVDVQSHLIEYVGNYLLVLGVGQVIQEAAALGYPAVITSTVANAGVTFLTQENLWDMVDANFARVEKDLLLEQNIKLLHRKERDQFNLVELFKEHFDISKQVDAYIDLIKDL